MWGSGACRGIAGDANAEAEAYDSELESWQLHATSTYSVQGGFLEEGFCGGTVSTEPDDSSTELVLTRRVHARDEDDEGAVWNEWG